MSAPESMWAAGGTGWLVRPNRQDEVEFVPKSRLDEAIEALNELRDGYVCALQSNRDVVPDIRAIDAIIAKAEGEVTMRRRRSGPTPKQVRDNAAGLDALYRPASGKESIRDVLAALHDTDLSDAQMLSEASKRLHIDQWRIVEHISRDPEFFGYGKAIDECEAQP